MGDRYVVLRDLARTFTAGPLEARREAGGPGEPHLETLDLTKGEARALAAEPDVAAVARSMPTALPVDVDGAAPAAPTDVTWGVAAVGAPGSTRTGEGSLVAVLDSGIDAEHAAFAGMEFVQKDFTGDGNGDKRGHGTHVAGTVFGRPVEGIRIGVAPGIGRALIGKVIRDAGGGTTDALLQAILWAAQEGADVITMSVSFAFTKAVEEDVAEGVPVFLATARALEGYRANLRLFDSLMRMLAERSAVDKGTVVVAATGNSSMREVNPAFEVGAELPAAADGVLAVGALRQVEGLLDVTLFSNTFADVCAPGKDVFSARLGGGLAAKNGTSMAAPHVAGVAALWWQALRETLPATSVTRASMVTNRLLAAATLAGFVPESDLADVGAGLALCPP
ncbi:S8 family peptidase [Nonomuraea sp. NPDC050790]|uniref:S8 family peptidase n=1 Tax=Nonomuraea sp. NPDC050790 TaxID=3364371 RepID=UPI0037B17135